MAQELHDDRDLLELLKLELLFLENGYYERLATVSGHPGILLRNSPTCLNFNDPERPHPCSACGLMRFVPLTKRQDAIPCHQIPLTESGETLFYLYVCGGQKDREAKLAEWLRAKIRCVEKERVLALQV
jgi:hypothetical protein